MIKPLLTEGISCTTSVRTIIDSVSSTSAGKVNPSNSNSTYGRLALLNAEKVMAIAAQFAAEGNQTVENLAALRADQVAGQWRDST